MYGKEHLVFDSLATLSYNPNPFPSNPYSTELPGHSPSKVKWLALFVFSCLTLLNQVYFFSFRTFSFQTEMVLSCPYLPPCPQATCYSYSPVSHNAEDYWQLRLRTTYLVHTPHPSLCVCPHSKFSVCTDVFWSRLSLF